MTKDAYTLMRRCIHFSDNTASKPKGISGYNPLYNVQYPLKVMMKHMRQAWTAGKYITIGESRIWYMGPVVSYVQ